MKIKTTITEIEATAEDLRQSKTLSDCFYNTLKMIFTPVYYAGDDEEKTEEQEE